jgi:hypothetical protein
MDQNNRPQPTINPQVTPPIMPTPHFAAEVPPMQAPKRRRKGLWASVIIAGTLVLLGGGSALAYNFWYQNPEKVISDGVAKAIMAKSVSYTGSYTLEGSDNDVRVQITGKNTLGASDLTANVTFQYGGKDVTATGDVIVDTNGDLYVRLSGVDVLVKDMRDSVPEGEGRQLMDQLIAKINNQWVKISVDDMKAFSESIGKLHQCSADAFKKARENDKVMNEIADVYKKHKFVIIEETLGEQNGSLGYSLRPDAAVMKEFNAAMKETEFYKTLQGCDEGITLNENVSSSNETMRTELWVDRWSHQITKITTETGQSGGTAKTVIEPRFNEEVAITAPEASTTLKQLQADIMQLMQQAQAANMPGNEPANDLFSTQL